MLERFTEPARRVLVLATEEARSRRHETVGPEHLLVGILQVGGHFVVHSLEQLGVSPETLRAEAERVLGETPGSATGGEPAFSPDSSEYVFGDLAGTHFATRISALFASDDASPHQPAQ